MIDTAQCWQQTFTGKRISPIAPDLNLICIQDIAHSLANQCRFAGHTKQFYSVAEHSVLVSHHCGEEHALWGLLHDASEAYLVDLPRPLKRFSALRDPYAIYEETLMRAVCLRFGLDAEMPYEVKVADEVALATEARDLITGVTQDWHLPFLPLEGQQLLCCTPEVAEELFLSRYTYLFGRFVKNVMGQER